MPISKLTLIVIPVTLWSHMISHDLTWPHRIAHDCTWSHMTAHDLTWCSHDLTGAHMTAHDLTWPHMTSYDLTWHYYYLNGEWPVTILCKLQYIWEHWEGGVWEDGYCSIDHQQVCHTVHEETKGHLSHWEIGEWYPGGGALHTSGGCWIYFAGLGSGGVGGGEEGEGRYIL